MEKMNITFMATVLTFVCLGVTLRGGRAFAGTLKPSKPVNAVSIHKSDIAETVARYGSFVMRLDNYDDHFLYDIRPLGDGRMGVIMLCPEGYEKNFVFQSSGTEITRVYEYVTIPRQTLLEAIQGKVIPVSDAKKFAREIARRNEECEALPGHA
ncbi:MAG: hypothetical protein LBO68_00710 [Synergistaceae bacterium]|nr:hypothetical protein [Synergistaceae bacterium]